MSRNSISVKNRTIIFLIYFHFFARITFWNRTDQNLASSPIYKKEKKIEDDSFWFRLVCLIARNVSKLEWLLLTFKFDEKSSKELIPLGSSSDLFWLAFFSTLPDRWWQIRSDVVVQLKKLKGQNQTWYSKLTLRPRPATPPLWNLSEKSSRIQPVLVI